ncbi:MAG: diguanylate cyclase [Enterobacterales bacterium]|nr:diguanylate cyclase [Enterobacterales bacterium]
MDYFLLSKISLRSRIFIGYFITAIITVVIIILFYLSLNNIFRNYNQLNDYNTKALLGSEISRNMSDLERAVTKYLTENDEYIVEKVELIHVDMAEHLADLYTINDAAMLKEIKTIETQLSLFHITFTELVKQKKLKDQLVEEELPKRIILLESQANQLNPSTTSIVQHKKDLYTKILMLEKSSRLFFSSYDSMHIKQTQQIITTIYELEEEIRSESKVDNLMLLKDIKLTLQFYESDFLEAVQRTRGYLYLSNVVMAAAVNEAIYNADKLADNINLSMLIIEQDMSELFERMITIAQYIGVSFLIISAIFAYAVGHSIADPIKQITDVFSRLEKGDSTTPIVGYRSNDELGDLTHAAEKFREKNIQNEDLLKSYKELAEQLEKKVSERTMDLERANQRLEELSNKDGLTGLFNRRFFDNRFHEEWSRSIRSNLPLALLMIDVDYFKSYNDHYGHQMGDDALICVAKTLHHVLKRDTDYAARYGGEEFVVILQDTNLEAAKAIAGSIRAELFSQKIEHLESSTGFLTVSIGISSRLESDSISDSHALLKRADKALYKSKENGRNKITVDS